jgi:hypothetical protein
MQLLMDVFLFHLSQGALFEMLHREVLEGA